MLLVTGATGHLGSKVVEAVLAKEKPRRVAVSVRNATKADHLRARGVDVRQGDFENAESLPMAFSGVERLLIISTDGDNETRIRQHRNAVAAAIAAGVRFVAYTSIAKADRTALGLGVVHRTTEAAIRESGIPYCFLRNNWYVENEIPFIRAALGGAPILTSAGAGRVGWAARDDYAEAAAAVLTGNGHEQAIYELSGAPISYDEFGKQLSAATGKEIIIEHLDDAEYERRLLGAGLPKHLAEFLTGLQCAIRRGALEVESDDLSNLLGRPATQLRDVLAHIALSVAAQSA